MPAAIRAWAAVALIVVLTLQVLGPGFAVGVEGRPDPHAATRARTPSSAGAPRERARGPARRAVFPTLGPGDRGSNVRAVQRLLRQRGRPAVVSGRYGPELRQKVVLFQGSSGIATSGVVDRTTWKGLVTRIRRGDRGQAVRAAQELLRHKARVSVPVNGRFGRSTKRAVQRFQRRMGLRRTGTVGMPTWRALTWQFELPDFRLKGLCDYNTMNGAAGNWGTASTVAWLERAARLFHGRTGLRIAVGDISLRYGGRMPGHHHHDEGLEADIRPMRTDGAQCGASGVNIAYGNYDRSATRQLVRALRDASDGHVKDILFNDRGFVRRGITRWARGHDDHLHIRWCETRHRSWEFRC